MKFTIDGKQYDIELESFTLDEGEIIEDFVGVSIADYPGALRLARSRAIRALVLIAKRRAGEQVEWADLGSLDLMELALSIIEDNGIDVAAAAASTGQTPEGVKALTDILAGRRQAAQPKTRKRAS